MSILSTPIPLGVNDGRMPNIDSPAGLPKEDRLSAQKMSQFYLRQYERGLVLRKLHAISWMKVKAILRGIHYYSMRGGFLRPLRQKQGQINTVIPIMKPLFRQELGRLNANTLGVTTQPASQDVDSIGKSDRAYNMLTHWINESRAHEFFDSSNQNLLIEGLVGYHRFVDEFNQQVRLSDIPGSRIFPIPFDAKIERELYGLMIVDFKPHQWLEQQDEMTEKRMFEEAQSQGGAKESPRNFRRMAPLSGRAFSGMSLEFPMFGASSGEAARVKGALVRHIFMKPTERTPNGEYLFMVEDMIFRYNATDGLFQKRIPIELVWYTKRPDDFWGDGFCEDIIAPQHMANRQASRWELQAKYNQGMLFYQSDRVDKDNLQSQDRGPFIPYKMGSYDQKDPPVFPVPPSRVSRDVPALFSLARDVADHAAGYRSGLLFGEAEGRNEGGPANSLLLQNAQSTILPVLDRIFGALSRTFPVVLDMLHNTWPEDKQIRVSSFSNVGRMFRYTKDQRPWSQDVIIKPIPLLPNGRNTLVNMLMQLKQMPGEGGQPGTLISNDAFLQSLRILDLLPPGIELVDSPKVRIQSRINRLINDTVKPAIQPADPGNPSDRLSLEDHREFVEQLKDVILEDTFLVFSPEVKKAILLEFRFHKDRLRESNSGPNAFDDDAETSDAMDLENFLANAEADLETAEGEFQTQLNVGPLQ